MGTLFTTAGIDLEIRDDPGHFVRTHVRVMPTHLRAKLQARVVDAFRDRVRDLLARPVAEPCGRIGRQVRRVEQVALLNDQPSLLAGHERRRAAGEVGPVTVLAPLRSDVRLPVRGSRTDGGAPAIGLAPTRSDGPVQCVRSVRRASDRDRDAEDEAKSYLEAHRAVLSRSRKIQSLVLHDPRTPRVIAKATRAFEAHCTKARPMRGPCLAGSSRHAPARSTLRGW